MQGSVCLTPVVKVTQGKCDEYLLLSHGTTPENLTSNEKEEKKESNMQFHL